jgi:hypothetical protein
MTFSLTECDCARGAFVFKIRCNPGVGQKDYAFLKNTGKISGYDKKKTEKKGSISGGGVL